MKSKILKIACVVFLGAFSLGFLTGAVTEFSLTKDYRVVHETYTVKQGDTFMDICLEYRKRDARELNPLVKPGHLSVGDELQIQYKVAK